MLLCDRRIIATVTAMMPVRSSRQPILTKQAANPQSASVCKTQYL
jgi:hypothetical protein